MHTEPNLSPEAGQQLNILLDAAVNIALKHEQAEPFLEWCSQYAPSIAPLLFPPQADAAEQHQIAALLARHLWNAMPLPGNQYRPKPLPKPQRNDPCLCGSGRKYKQCCASMESSVPPAPNNLLLEKVLERTPQKYLSDLPLKWLSLETLAQIAESWVERGEAKRAAAMLEPAFTDVSQLDERAEWAFDTLANAYVELDKPKKRIQLVESVMQAPNVWLRSAALHRRATMYADERDFAAAWQVFKDAQRLQPDNVSLSHLEVLLLICENRREEAEARAEFWIARLKRMGGYDNLIEQLQRMIASFDAIQHELMPQSPVELEQLKTLAAQLPQPVCLYRLEVQDGDAGELTPLPQLAELEQTWRQRFFGDEKFGIDPEEALFDALNHADEWLGWLQDNPDALHSFSIIEQLTDVGMVLVGEDDSWLDGFVAPLAAHAEQLLRCVLAANQAETCRLEWGWLNNRPALRAIQNHAWLLVQQQQDLDAAQALLEWLLNTLNPADNQGIRFILARLYLLENRPQPLLDLLKRHGDESAELMYHRALALYMAGKKAEAKRALQHAAERWPEVLKMLQALKPRKPKLSQHGVTAGGKDEAWLYRDQFLPLWQQYGADSLLQG